MCASMRQRRDGSGPFTNDRRLWGCDMTFDTTTIPGGTTAMTGELYAPPGSGAAGLVVLAYGTDGFVDNERGPWQTMMRGYAEDLATRGLFALIPDYFARTGSRHGGAAVSDIAVKRDDWSAALVDTVRYARTLSRVDAGRIGMLGFSLGGHLCLHARAAARPKALVEYFAPMFDGIGARGSVPNAQIHHGTLDEFPTQFSNAGQIEGILSLEGPNVTLFSYKGATHGFAGKDAANTSAAAQSKTRTVTFFSKCL
jgi:carboxymethylenebutenolidase